MNRPKHNARAARFLNELHNAGDVAKLTRMATPIAQNAILTGRLDDALAMSKDLLGGFDRAPANAEESWHEFCDRLAGALFCGIALGLLLKPEALGLTDLGAPEVVSPEPSEQPRETRTRKPTRHNVGLGAEAPTKGRRPALTLDAIEAMSVEDVQALQRERARDARNW